MRRPSAPILRGSAPSGVAPAARVAVAPAGLDAERGAGRDQRRLERPDERSDHAGRGRDSADDRVRHQLAGTVVGHLAAALDPDDLDAAREPGPRRRRGCGPGPMRDPGSAPRDARGAAADRGWRRPPARRRDASGAPVPRDSRSVRAMPPRSAPARGRPAPIRESASRSPRPHDSRTRVRGPTLGPLGGVSPRDLPSAGLDQASDGEGTSGPLGNGSGAGRSSGASYGSNVKPAPASRRTRWNSRV